MGRTIFLCASGYEGDLKWQDKLSKEVKILGVFEFF
jgi:hypothetical protein